MPFSISPAPVRTILPASTYIGSLPAGANTLVNFSVTPYEETTLNVTLNYDNGDNHHSCLPADPDISSLPTKWTLRP